MGSSNPDSFIKIAEESGLIVPIGEQVLRDACTECRKWHDEGFEQLTVSVNISPTHFQNHHLESLIMRVLGETGLEPESLEIELTESTVMKDPERAAAILRNLKKLGIKISIDDFGTGFSSLSYLKNFPIDILKIDKSFITNLEWDTANSAIASAVIGLAHNLNLRVVAEGVETEEQLEFLQKGDCDFAQGYHISKPKEITGSVKKLIAGMLLQKQ